jgi:hypothetical protein
MRRILNDIFAGLLVAFAFVITIGVMMVFIGTCIMTVIGLTVMSYLAAG